MYSLKKLWHELFLVERPSMLLALFRIPIAFTVMVVVIPSFFHLDDTFFPTAFKEYNTHFFIERIIEWVQLSPIWLIKLMVGIFVCSGLGFLLGLFTQLSGIIVLVSCYYFYALNAFAVGTLSWDILLVTLVLMVLTPYPGDYFSLDSIRKRNCKAYKTKRPFFIQRLLQIQLAGTFLFTALHKITIEGNWLTGNPIYYLMNYPPQGVVKNFILKDVLQHWPTVCYWIGIFIVMMEFLIPFLLFCVKTRITAIYLGFIFHLMLLLTLDVPATFFFVFPMQMLLFINPSKIELWVESQRVLNQHRPKPRLLYDGSCAFCQHSVEMLLVLDVFENVEIVDGSALNSDHIKAVHPDLNAEKLTKKLCLVNNLGELYEGFYVFRSLCWIIPMMMPMALIFYFPGSGMIGPMIYQWIAKYRYLIFGKKACGKQCSTD